MSRTRPQSRLHGSLSAAFATSLCVLAVFGCNDDPAPAQPARFNRPNRVEFVCVNGVQVVPLSDCKAWGADNLLAPHALVTQTGRGEVAVVNMRPPAQVIDSRRDIPGYTFIPVGESPRAIVTPPKRPQHTYVASFGSRDVRVLRTRALVATVTDKPDAQRVLLRHAGGETLLAPTDMVLAPDESALFVAVADSPEGGLVLRLPIVRCDAGSDPGCEDGLIDEAAISALPLTETALPPALAVTPSTYEELCSFERREQVRPAQLKLSAGDLAVPARPSALAVDAFCEGDGCTRRLLVADSAQPVIHAIDIDAWAASGSGKLLPAIATGTPTKDVVVTPRVPSDVTGGGATQYVYAIDAHDGSVLAIENDQLLDVYGLPDGEPPVPGQRSDRLRSIDGEEGALALEVVTPAFDVNGEPGQYVRAATKVPAVGTDDQLACTDEDFPEEEPRQLRGVFLAVARTDGSVHVFDVHDMELRPSNDGAPCRQCARHPGGKDDPGTEPDESIGPLAKIPVLVRNHERLLASFVPSEGQTEVPSFVPQLVTLRYVVDATAFGVRDDGTTASPRAPGLACIQCDETLTRAFPTESDEEAEEEAPGPSDGGTTDGGTTDGGTADGGTADGGTADGGMADGGVPEPSEESCPDPSLVCVANDPWSSGEDSWAAAYESLLPGTSRSRGRFVDGGETGGLELLTGDNPCAAGVLGEDDIAADYGDDCKLPVIDKKTGKLADPEVCASNPDQCVEDAAGDQVVLDTPPLDRQTLALLKGANEKELELCAEVAAELEADPKLRVAFEIRRAFRDRLVLRHNLVRPIGKARRFSDIQPCFEATVGFEVRSQQAFTVRGVITGFQHRVVETGNAGRCQVDPSGDPLRAGRARLGCTFRNHSIQFRLPDARFDNDLDQLLGVRLDVGFQSSARKLIFQAGSLQGFGTATVVTEQLRYNPVDQRLYLVDINERGLLPIPLDPVPPALGVGGQFN